MAMSVTGGSGDSLSERLGRALRSHASGDRIGAIAAAVAGVWLALALAYAIGFFGVFESPSPANGGATAVEIALIVLAIVAPVVLIAFGAFLLRQTRELKRETERLSAAIEALHRAPAPETRESAGRVDVDMTKVVKDAVRKSLAAERDALLAAISRVESAAAAPASESAPAGVAPPAPKEATAPTKPTETVKRTGAAPAPDVAQPALPFTADDSAAPEGVTWSSVVRALDFPRHDKDREGFAAIRAVIADKEFAELLQAAEDMLSLLSEDGLYMEDLGPDLAPLEVWHSYATGARGADEAAIGGVRDDRALEVAGARLKRDLVFRDAALHFVRRFNKVLERMGRELGPDPLLREAGDTRTGRAFMLMARVGGAFD